MSTKKLGAQTVALANPPSIAGYGNVVGKKEGEGPLKDTFDYIDKDDTFGQPSWEKSESEMQKQALTTALSRAGKSVSELDFLFAGDLLNQCISSSFTLRNYGIPHLGLYGACSTMAESLLIGSMIISGRFNDNVVAMTSSHFASSERQYRFPLGYGGQRTPTAQWTVTGAGAVLLKSGGIGPKIEACTIGSVVDQGIKDANNMGAAMAPAALATIRTHFQDLNVTADHYDLIVTGDLGQLGKDILLTLAQHEGLDLGGKLTDCGNLVYDNLKQDVHSGGSGCGCSAVTLCSYLLPRIASGKLKRILFCGTGALLSPTSALQGLPIPGVCHAVSISGGSL